jgi:hypothetical protein
MKRAAHLVTALMALAAAALPTSAGRAAGSFGYLGQWGCSGTGDNRQLDYPQGVAVPDGGDSVFVSRYGPAAGAAPGSAYVAEVLVFSPSGTLTAKWGAGTQGVDAATGLGLSRDAPGELIAVGSGGDHSTVQLFRGSSLAAKWDAGQIVESAVGGTVSATVGGNSQTGKIWALVSPGGNLTYYNEDGTLNASGSGGVYRAAAISGFASDLYIADAGIAFQANSVGIEKLSGVTITGPPNGKYLSAVASAHWATSFTPISLWATPDAVWVSGESNSSLVFAKFDHSGQLLAQYGENDVPGGMAASPVSGTPSITADSQGNVYLADRGNSRIVRFGPGGGLPPGGGGPGSPMMNNCGPLPTTGPGSTAKGAGYNLVASDGGIFNFGGAKFLGSTGATHLNQPIVGMAPTPSGNGYWLVASDGGIFNYGDARFLGSTGATHLNEPIVGMAPTPSGNGYWLVASDGGIFNYGDARFLGSTGAVHLNEPIVGMAPTPSGNGYWLAASDGGIFNFGDARFLGSTGGTHLNEPIVGMAPTPSGNGYWLAASDGGIFNFGDARFLGSTGAVHLNEPIVGMAPTPTGNGYWLVAWDGGIFNFGDASFMGSTGAAHLNQPIVGMARIG